jgi:hypothetical protein
MNTTSRTPLKSKFIHGWKLQKEIDLDVLEVSA